jgi:hypothetical protein
MSSDKLVVVDVQPCYRDAIHFNVYQFAEFINSYADVLVFFNGEDICANSLDEIEDMYDEMGVDIDNVTFVEKDYAFLRGWMDTGVDHEVISKFVAYMIENGENDSRELVKHEDDPVLQDLVAAAGFDEVEDLEEGDIIYMPNMQVEGRWMAPQNFIPLWDGADIVGGGCHECLREIELLAAGMNTSFNQVGEFVYGQ